MIKFIKKIGMQNWLMKPLSTVTTAALPTSYLIYGMNSIVQEDLGNDLVAVSSGLVNGIQGSIIMLVILLSVVQTYKPPKVVVVSLIVGGLMMFASSLFATLGVTLLLYGVGYLLNNMTVDKLVVRNDKLKVARQEQEVERLL